MLSKKPINKTKKQKGTLTRDILDGSGNVLCVGSTVYRKPFLSAKNIVFSLGSQIKKFFKSGKVIFIDTKKNFLEVRWDCSNMIERFSIYHENRNTVQVGTDNLVCKDDIYLYLISTLEAEIETINHWIDVNKKDISDCEKKISFFKSKRNKK